MRVGRPTSETGVRTDGGEATQRVASPPPIMGENPARGLREGT
jgi:hypothetical protein